MPGKLVAREGEEVVGGKERLAALGEVFLLVGHGVGANRR
jgi:hypothetical protein